jgi:hypothetical protein
LVLQRFSVVLILLLGSLATSVFAGAPNVTPVSQCRSLVGQQVTVKGRTSSWVRSKGEGVYLLRDDDGDTIYVRITPEAKSTKDSMIMGFTYYVTGTPEVDPVTNELSLREVNRWRAYPLVSPWALVVVAVLLAAGIATVAIMVRRRQSALPPAWGYAEVVSGPDQGQRFDLRGNRVVVGRGQDRLTAVSIVEDGQVSRDHGLVLREGDALCYEDTNSKNGSWVDGQQALPGQRVPLNRGSLLKVGPMTVIRFGPAGASTTETMVVDAGVTETAGEESEERMPEPPE